MILDAIILGFVGLFVWRGARRGLLMSLTGLVGFVVAAFAAVFGFRALAVPLEAVGLSTGVANLAGGLVIFVGVMAGMYVVGRTLSRALKWTKLGALNTAGGAVLAGAWAMSWVLAALLAISVLPVPHAIAASYESSTIGKGIVAEAPRWASRLARADLRSMLTFFVPRERTVSIRATERFRRAPGAERALFDLIAHERDLEDLRALAWDEDLATAARRHAADMYRRGFFGHRNPDGTTPERRLRAAGAVFGVMAENLALSETIRVAHARLMASPNHRRNVLRPDFGRIGIGVMIGPQGYLLAVEFAG